MAGIYLFLLPFYFRSAAFYSLIIDLSLLAETDEISADRSTLDR
ncbi:MAG: hypothetical protein ACTSU2_08315 [Promethearchaeota archaeon]